MAGDALDIHPFPYLYRWGNNPMRATMRGRRCRVLVRARRFNSCLVEFEDGRLAVVSRNALRRIVGPKVQAPDEMQ